MVTTVTRSIGAILSSAAHGVVRGLAVVALVVVWSVSHVGTHALSVVGVSSALLTTTATPADAQWRAGVVGAAAAGAAGGGDSPLTRPNLFNAPNPPRPPASPPRKPDSLT
jgi:hypothetical protein